ncbi:MAG: metallophosphoesterase family protein [Elusimicrobiales bacterium]
MKYGVISDIHGNYEALAAALNFLEEFSPDGYFCCGDLVGYGPQPNECVEMVRSLKGLHCVIGNHDMAAIGQLPVSWFNSCAAQALGLTRAILSDESVQFLESLPKTLEVEDITIVHGSPKNPAEEYLLTGEQFLESMEVWHTRACIVGHSHVPFVMSCMGVRFPLMEGLTHRQKITMLDGHRYIFNPGSVGQPRDRNPRVSCALYDSQERAFQLFRLEYPIAATQKMMRSAGLPELLVERIGNGW